MEVVFYRSASGHEPVRDWLKDLPRNDMRRIGAQLKLVQLGWPMGMPLIRKLEPGLWELRCRLDRRIARVLFTVQAYNIILLHGFIKKSQKTPKGDVELARKRKERVEAAS